MDTPAHEHDCSECVFVGGDAPQVGEPRVNQVDMYVSECSYPLRRYSSRPDDYACLPLEAASQIEKYQRVIAAAKAMGVL